MGFRKLLQRLLLPLPDVTAALSLMLQEKELFQPSKKMDKAPVLCEFGRLAEEALARVVLAAKAFEGGSEKQLIVDFECLGQFDP